MSHSEVRASFKICTYVSSLAVASAEYFSRSPGILSTPVACWLCNLLNAVRISSSDIGRCNGPGVHTGTP